MTSLGLEICTGPTPVSTTRTPSHHYHHHHCSSSSTNQLLREADVMVERVNRMMASSGLTSPSNRDRDVMPPAVGSRRSAATLMSCTGTTTTTASGSSGLHPLVSPPGSECSSLGGAALRETSASENHRHNGAIAASVDAHHYPSNASSVARSAAERNDFMSSNNAPSSTFSHGGSNRTAMAPNVNASDSVVIEEKRRRPHGDGYTYHRYLRGRMLGKGGFAKVYLCTAMDTGKNYAVKIVPKANLVKARARQKLQAEIKIHRTLKHRRVCEFKHFFEDRENCYILLELCHNQSLNEMIKRRKRLTEPEAALFMSQLLDAVKYMHDENVIHRDLKLGNLFLDRHMHIKVGDLGLATRLDDKDEKRKTICGTPNYIAPEVIQHDKTKRGHSFEVDVWSMGVILYTILMGKPPYEAKDVKATYQRILKNEYSFPEHLPISEHAMDLIECMLQLDPNERPSLEYIGHHPFLNPRNVPESLPQSALHAAPTWTTSEHGFPVAVEDDSVRKFSKLPSSRASGRTPFGSHDANTAKSTQMVPGNPKKENAPANEAINMQRIVKNALLMSSAKANVAPNVATANTASSGFDIYDETTGATLQSATAQVVATKPPKSPRTSEDLIARAKALCPPRRVADLVPSTSTATSCAYSHQESDADTFHRMVERLDMVLEVVETRRGSYRPTSPRPTTSASKGGPSIWVTRYVDYTSKYGLGFLLNDGSSGVYFNDSTKTTLQADSETFQYIERKKCEHPENKRGDIVVETHTLSSYPDRLNKKVTLLKHFRNYLLEQQKQADEDFLPVRNSHYSGGAVNLVFMKKWIRTKHAILFRLSNQVVQVAFYDQTEILLTPDDRYITYVDKNRVRQMFNFTDDLVGSFPELEKRVKYARDIMHQLLSGQRQSSDPIR